MNNYFLSELLRNYYDTQDYLKAFYFGKEDCHLHKSFLSFSNLAFCIDKVTENKLLADTSLLEELESCIPGKIYFLFKTERYYECILVSEEYLSTVTPEYKEARSYVAYILAQCFNHSKDIDRASYWAGYSNSLNPENTEVREFFWNLIAERWKLNEAFSKDIFTYLENKLGNSLNILDIGPCKGYWGSILRPLAKELIGVEAYEPNVVSLQEKHFYDKIITSNIQDFKYIEKYDVIVFGDIIEHLKIEDAFAVLNAAYEHCKEMIVIVPFYYWQTPERDANPFEEHLQPDLCEAIMTTRYPMLKRLVANDIKGLYIKNMEYTP